ncbi:MAG: Glycine cleavage system H protein [Phycisphaerae bacterium]|nr:Glycine cleavage system H protein [Phycisphaerae bacterium]
MASPSDRRYSKSHEWAKKDNGQVTVGISQFAVDELTDITYVELPAVGAAVRAGKAFGEIESVKATSELFSPISGKIVAVNEQLADDPGLINNDPWEAGWLIRVQPSNATELDALLDSQAYDAQAGSH